MKTMDWKISCRQNEILLYFSVNLCHIIRHLARGGKLPPEHAVACCQKPRGDVSQARQEAHRIWVGTLNDRLGRRNDVLVDLVAVVRQVLIRQALQKLQLFRQGFVGRLVREQGVQLPGKSQERIRRRFQLLQVVGHLHAHGNQRSGRLARLKKVQLNGCG